MVVTGRVQGVAFRVATRDAAVAAGARGWVRNRADGAVEAHVEGTAEAVEAVIRFARTGPRAARVNRVEVEPAAPSGAAGFAIAPDA
ncbi:MAG: acylphosphatase [Thermoleophilia bacterium]